VVEVLLRRGLDHATHRKHEERESLERPPRSCNSRGSACRYDWTNAPLTALNFTEQRAAFQCGQWVQCVSGSVCPALLADESVGLNGVKPDLPGFCSIIHSSSPNRLKVLSTHIGKSRKVEFNLYSMRS
jgi:hypothetical protein